MIFKDDMIRELEDEAEFLKKYGDAQEISTYLGDLTILIHSLTEIQQAILSDSRGYKAKHAR